MGHKGWFESAMSIGENMCEFVVGSCRSSTALEGGFHTGKEHVWGNFGIEIMMKGFAYLELLIQENTKLCEVLERRVASHIAALERIGGRSLKEHIVFGFAVNGREKCRTWTSITLH
jgi:hypothetical protein